MAVVAAPMSTSTRGMSRQRSNARRLRRSVISSPAPPARKAKVAGSSTSRAASSTSWRLRKVMRRSLSICPLYGQMNRVLVDADVHHMLASNDLLTPYLPERWARYNEQFGLRYPDSIGYFATRPRHFACRTDAWPPNGGVPGGDLDFMREQLLDAWPIEAVILNPINQTTCGSQFVEFARRAHPRAERLDARRVARAGRPPLRLDLRPVRGRGARRRGGRAARAATRASSRCSSTCGRASRSATASTGRCTRRPRRTACRSRSTSAATAATRSPAPAGPRTTSRITAGYPQAFQAQVLSLVVEGVFERFPGLKVVLQEGGFAWLPWLMWRTRHGVASCSATRSRTSSASRRRRSASTSGSRRSRSRSPSAPSASRSSSSELGMHGPGAVRHRLPALGLRRARPGAAARRSATRLRARSSPATPGPSIRSSSRPGRGGDACRRSTATSTPRRRRSTRCGPYLDEYWREYAAEAGFRGAELGGDASTRRTRRRRGAPGADDSLDGLAAHLDARGCGLRDRELLLRRRGAPQRRLRERATPQPSTTGSRPSGSHRDDRLRAAIVVKPDDPAGAAAEIERLAGDPRFVARAAPRARRPARTATAPTGRCSRRRSSTAARSRSTSAAPPATRRRRSAGRATTLEEYVGMAHVFEAQLTSLIAEGAFERFPELRVVLLESGFTWLPPLLWRLDKEWKGLRREIPWVTTAPSADDPRACARAVQPIDGPRRRRRARAGSLDQLGSDELLVFSSDYPHAHARSYEEALGAVVLARSSTGGSGTATPRELYRPVSARATSSPRRARSRPGGHKLVTRRRGARSASSSSTASTSRSATAARTRAARSATGTCCRLARVAAARASYASRARGGCCSARGTAGSSTSAPGRAGASRIGCASARTPSAWSRPGRRAAFPASSPDRTSPRRIRSASRRAASSWTSAGERRGRRRPPGRVPAAARPARGRRRPRRAGRRHPRRPVPAGRPSAAPRSSSRPSWGSAAASCARR